MGQRRAGAKQGPRLIRASSRPTSYPPALGEGGYRSLLGPAPAGSFGATFPFRDRRLYGAPVAWGIPADPSASASGQPVRPRRRCFGGAEDSGRGWRAIIADATTSSNAAVAVVAS
jgi:hypothetical protein